MKNTKFTALILVGGPKSGLSALFECLSLSGIKTICGSTDSIFPSAESINRLLFQELESSPKMIGGLPENWMNTAAAEKTRGRIRSMLSQFISNSGVGMLVGSSLCRTLPIWIAVCDELNIESRVIVMIRHPWDVAQALSADTSMDLAEGNLLWLAHLRDVMLACQNQSHTIVTFDQLLADPVTSFVRIGQQLSMTWPINPWSIKTELLRRVQPGLKHHNSGALTDKDKQIYRPYEQLYRKMRFDHDIAQEISVELDLSFESGSAFRNQNVTFYQHAICTEPNLIDCLLARIAKYEKQVGVCKKQQQIAFHSDSELFAEVLLPSSRQGGNIQHTIPLITDEWNKISLAIPEPQMLKEKQIVLLPLNANGMVKVSGIRLVNEAAGEVIWEVSSLKCFDELAVVGQKIRIPSRNQLYLLVFGQETRIIFPIKHAIPDCPLVLEMWIKVSMDMEEISKLFGENPYRVAPNKTAINTHFMSKLKAMNSLGGFHQQFRVRSDEFNKISTAENDNSLIKAKTFWGAEIYLLPKNEIVSSKIYSYGLFEPELCSFFIDYLHQGAVLIDIGSHIGFFSMLAAELVSDTGKVYAFEPTPSTREVLSMNVKPYSQVISVPKLVWSSETQLDFHNYGIQFSAYNTAVSNRLSPQEQRLTTDNCIKVDAITLDAFCKDHSVRPDLVKIDAESSEMQVLQGMTWLLENVRPVLTIEVGDMESAQKDGVPLSRELLEFVMRFDYLPLNSVGGRYQYHELKDEYVYDNIILVPIEKLPVRRPLGAVAVQPGSLF